MLIAMAAGDEARALQVRSSSTSSLPAPLTRPGEHHIRLALLQGDLDEASRWGDLLMRLDGESPIGFLDRLTLIRLLGILGRRAELAQQIERLYRGAGIAPLAPEWKGWLIRFGPHRRCRRRNKRRLSGSWRKLFGQVSPRAGFVHSWTWGRG